MAHENPNSTLAKHNSASWTLVQQNVEIEKHIAHNMVLPFFQ